MQQAEIASGFAKRLAAFPNAWPWFLAGNDYKPDSSKAYMRATLIMAPPATISIGRGVFSRQKGIYQIDLYYPQNVNGQKALDTYAEGLRRWFFPVHNRGLNLIEGSTKIYINRLPHIAMGAADRPFIRRMMDVYFEVEDVPT